MAILSKNHWLATARGFESRPLRHFNRYNNIFERDVCLKMYLLRAYRIGYALEYSAQSSSELVDASGTPMPRSVFSSMPTNLTMKSRHASHHSSLDSMSFPLRTSR